MIPSVHEGKVAELFAYIWSDADRSNLMISSLSDGSSTIKALLLCLSAGCCLAELEAHLYWT